MLSDPSALTFPKLSPLVVPFPSFGLVYPESSPFHKRTHVYIKQMTPLEEDVLLSETNYRDGSLVNKLVYSAIVDPVATYDDVVELVSGDKEAILLALRVTGYGQQLNFKIPCPGCEADKEMDIDLGATEIQELGGNFGPENSGLLEVGVNLFEVTLPLSKKRVEFKLPTGIELTRGAEDENIPRSLRAVIGNVCSIDGTTDKEQITNILLSLKIKDSSALRIFFNAIKPYVDINYTFLCDSCGHKEAVWFPCNNTIFHIQPKDREMIWLEPYFLLGYYFGMDWNTYLQYPVFYRKWLIERINKEIKSASEQGADIPSKAPHDNTAEIRHLSNKMKQNVTSAKLQRFT